MEHIQINGLRVRTLGIDPAVVEVTVLTQGEGEVSIQIQDGDRIVAEARGWSDGKAVFTRSIPNARLWSVEHLNLYTCKAAFGADSCETRFGIRSWTWGPHGLLLNGKRIILRGACIHHDNGVLGARCCTAAERRKIRILKENGYNAIDCTSVYKENSFAFPAAPR